MSFSSCRAVSCSWTPKKPEVPRVARLLHREATPRAAALGIAVLPAPLLATAGCGPCARRAIFQVEGGRAT
eukprot:6790279-Lingulodinium_polyedra.AAC.1